MSGKLLRPFVDKFVIQWPDAAGHRFSTTTTTTKTASVREKEEDVGEVEVEGSADGQIKETGRRYRDHQNRGLRGALSNGSLESDGLVYRGWLV